MDIKRIDTPFEDILQNTLKSCEKLIIIPFIFTKTNGNFRKEVAVCFFSLKNVFK